MSDTNDYPRDSPGLVQDEGWITLFRECTIISSPSGFFISLYKRSYGQIAVESI